MKLHPKNAQTAIEYLILLSLVAVIVMFSFSNLLPRATRDGGAVSSLFRAAGSSIMGEKVQSIDGNWCEWSACDCDDLEGAALADCLATLIGPNGQRVKRRLCDCPAPLGDPAGGGALCSGASIEACS